MPTVDTHHGNPGGVVRGTPDPPRFDHSTHSDNDRLEALNSWLDGFEAYCEAFYGHDGSPAQGDHVPNSQWKRLLRIALAPATISIIRNRFPDIKDNSVTYNSIISHLQYQFGSLKSEYATMNVLLDVQQKSGETFSSFHDRISGLAARSGLPCGLCRDYLVRHLAIRGTSCVTIRASALQNKWTTEELPIRAREVEISTAASATSRKIPTLRVELEEDVKESALINRIGGPYSKSARRTQEARQSQGSSSGSCRWCGRTPRHDRSQCPASRSPCNKCGRLGHFARVCLSSRPREQSMQQFAPTDDQVQKAQPATNETQEVAYYDVFQIYLDELNRSPIVAPITAGASKLTAIVDTGAQANVCPLWAINSRDKRGIKPCNVSIRPFGSTPIHPVGAIVLQTSWGGRTVQTEWLIVDDSKLNRKIEPIASKSLVIALKMINLDPRLVGYTGNPKMTRNKMDNALCASNLQPNTEFSAMRNGDQTQEWVENRRFAACFKGLGLLRGYTVRLFLKANAKPFISPPRTHPYYLQPQMRKL